MMVGDVWQEELTAGDFKQVVCRAQFPKGLLSTDGITKTWFDFRYLDPHRGLAGFDCLDNSRPM